MQFSDNEIIALLFGTSLSEPGGMYVLLQLVPAVNQKRSATNSGDGKTLRKRHTIRAWKRGRYGVVSTGFARPQGALQKPDHSSDPSRERPRRTEPVCSTGSRGALSLHTRFFQSGDERRQPARSRGEPCKGSPQPNRPLSPAKDRGLYPRQGPVIEGPADPAKDGHRQAGNQLPDRPLRTIQRPQIEFATDAGK